MCPGLRASYNPVASEVRSPEFSDVLPSFYP